MPLAAVLLLHAYFVAWPNVLSPTSEELKQHIQTLRLADWQRQACINSKLSPNLNPYSST